MTFCKRVLVVGRDPNFAWALGRILKDLTWNLEHVYTVSEVKTRFALHDYDLCLLDGLKLFEREMIFAVLPPSTRVVIIDTEQNEAEDTFLFIRKGEPLHSVVSALRQYLNV